MKAHTSLLTALLLSLTVTAAASRVNVSVSTPPDGYDDFGYTLPPDTTSTERRVVVGIPDSTILKNISTGSILSQSPLRSGSNGDEEITSPLDNIIPRSPDAAVLARYGEYPVSLATGLPQIEIPIYNITLGDVTMPISLSYHASGIKACDVASVVGLGWVLNAGGGIFRTVMGAPDLKGRGDDFDYSCREKSYVDSVRQRCQDGHGNSPMIHGITVNSLKSNWDSESDRYTYNFCGHSGIFRYSHRDREFITLDGTPLYVKAWSGEDSRFRIVDGHGLEYFFDEQEHVGRQDDENNTDVSAWYLTKVRTPYGDITLNYTRAQTDFYTWSFSQTYEMGVFSRLDHGEGHWDLYEKYNGAASYDSYVRWLHRIPLLNSISWPGGSVSFEYSGDRLDIPVYRLTRISVVNSLGDTLRCARMDNGHYFGNDSTDYRMMLEGVSLSDEGKYGFSYDTTHGYLPAYPPHVSGTDYWGYYNGRTGTNNHKCDRTAMQYVVNAALYNSVAPYGALSIPNLCLDKSPVFSYTKLGVLTDINYPSGGSTAFEYSQNRVPGWDVGGLCVSRMTDKDSDGTIAGQRTFTYTDAHPTHHAPAELSVYKGYGIIRDENNSGFETAVRFRTESSPFFSPYSDASPVFYCKVRETFADSTYTVAEYSDGRYYDYEPYDFSPYNPIHPMLYREALHDEGSCEPRLSSRKTYSEEDQLISEEIFQYTKEIVRSFSVGTRAVCLLSGLTEQGNPEYFSREYIKTDSVTAHVKVFSLVSKTVTDHTTGVTTEEHYTYDPQHRTLQPKTVSVTNSDSLTHTTEYTYAFEGTDSVCRDLTDNYLMYDAIIAKRRYCGGRLMSTVATDYTHYVNTDSPQDPSEWYLPYRYSSSTLNRIPTERYRITEFGPNATIRTLVTNRTDTTAVEWGYGNTLPTAVAQGLSYSRLVTALSSPGSVTTPYLLTTYTHRPLFGVTGITSPNGYTTGYTYTTGGRLDSIKDYTGTLSTYQYHYRNDGSGTTIPSFVRYNNMTSAGGDMTSTVQYHDGLGRPTVRAVGGLGTQGRYAYTLTTYDLRSRRRDEWLPVPTGMTQPSYMGIGGITQNAQTAYSGDYPYIYSTTEYDALGRPLSVTTPGMAWHDADRKTTKEYVTNAANEVMLYHAPLDSVSLRKDGCYAPGTLTGERTADEDGNILTTYKDKLGRTVLERRDANGTAAGGWHDTYYVYNDLGQLRYVLSPEYQQAGYKDKYAYEYRYDERGRLVKRFLPGCEYEQYWYDSADRQVFSQDGELRKKGLYRFTFYDNIGRPCVTGTCRRLDGNVNGNVCFNTTNSGVCGTGYVLERPETMAGHSIETVNYYDSYTFLSATAHNDTIFSGFAAPTSQVGTTGLVCGTVTAATDGTLLGTVMEYDAKGRVTKTVQRNLTGSIETTETTYTFTGKPSVHMSMVQGGAGKTLTVKTEYTYDQNTDLPLQSIQRVTKHYGSSHASNAPAHTISSLAYDALGRVTSDTRHGNAGTVGYTYNLRGWTTGITTPSFTEHLYYNSETGNPNSTGNYCYNGNISAMTWSNSGYDQLRGYKFTYDRMSRLRSAVYGERSDLSNKVNRFNESVDEYSLNGSIKHLVRRGKKNDGEYGKIDNLHAYYDGNQLQRVEDNAIRLLYNGSMDFKDSGDSEVEYTYNDNGALTSDKNRGIALIEYDNSNNPKRVQFTNGNVTEYIYTATGQKLRTIHYTATSNITVPMGTTHTLTQNETQSIDSTDYLLGGTYRLTNGMRSMYLFPGGYCNLNDPTVTNTGDLGTNNISYHYYNKDHLGNNREVISESGAIEQIVHYYPFGTPFTDGSSTNIGLQPYLYGNKELDMMHGLNTYDFGARNYNPLLGQFTTMDRFCEKHYSITPYNYCLENPVNCIDPDGMDAWVLVWATQSSDAEGVRRIGHTGVVVENFNSSYISTGTYTYYDLWPSNICLGGKAAVQDVDAIYNSQSFYILTNGLKDTNYSSLERYMSFHDMSQLPGILQNNIVENSIDNYGEHYSPDGIIRLGLDEKQSYLLQQEYVSLIEKGTLYNGESNNCTTFVANGINNSGVGIVKEESIIDWRGLFVNFNPFHRSFTPNSIYNQLKTRPGSVVVKNADNKTIESYEDAIIDR